MKNKLIFLPPFIIIELLYLQLFRFSDALLTSSTCSTNLPRPISPLPSPQPRIRRPRNSHPTLDRVFASWVHGDVLAVSRR